MVKSCTLGGIVKVKAGGYGFRVSFPDALLAQQYKEMMYFIIKNDGFQIDRFHASYDKKLGVRE